MTALLENHKEAITDLYRKYSIQQLFVLGSTLGTIFDQGKALLIFTSHLLPLAASLNYMLFEILNEPQRSPAPRQIPL